MPVIKKDTDLQTVITTYEVTPGTCADLCEQVRINRRADWPHGRAGRSVV